MAIREIGADKSVHVIYLRTPRGLVARIDAYAKANSLKTRTKAVFKLLQDALHTWEWETKATVGQTIDFNADEESTSR